METISCHSNHSSYQTGIKIITFVEKKNFEYFFFENLPFISPRQPIKQANSENLCPPPRFFLRNSESSENVKFIGGFIHTRYILST